jgi:DNA-directed RNA polymerase specialized sigma24 family protein
MADAIDAVNANPNSAVQYAPTYPHKATVVAAQDSVVLSSDARAKLLEQQGLSVNEIANSLGIPITTVQSDLGIAVVAG